MVVGIVVRLIIWFAVAILYWLLSWELAGNFFYSPYNVLVCLGLAYTTILLIDLIASWWRLREEEEEGNWSLLFKKHLILLGSVLLLAIAFLILSNDYKDL